MNMDELLKKYNEVGLNLFKLQEEKTFNHVRAQLLQKQLEYYFTEINCRINFFMNELECNKE